MGDVQSTIQLAAKRSGLSAHLIRMWEKRYEAVRPARTGSRRRLYSEEDIERLGLLRAATTAGHRIGNIAKLPTDRLRVLAGNESGSSTTESKASQSPENAVGAALKATREMSASDLESTLEQAAVAFGTHGLLRNVIGPFARRLGDQWAEGSLTAAHEHFASGIIKTFLQNRFRPYAGTGGGPLLMVTTPSGQLHEIGAAMVSAAARDAGWQVVYLGASLPATEIAGAAIEKGARAVALSIVYPSDDPALGDELKLLRKLLPERIALMAGGRAASAYTAALTRIGASQAEDLSELNRLLERLRTPAAV